MLGFLKEKKFWLHVLMILITALVLIYVVQLWLKQYTHHGQELKMQRFIDLPLAEAEQLASEHSFRLFVTDSVHLIGKPGGQVITQNPSPDDLVKQNRKVYVTVTKHTPDMITVADLPDLYAKNYKRKKKALKVGYSIDAEIVGEVYDKGPEGYIMAVIHQGDTIVTRDKRKVGYKLPKGAKLKFVVSKSKGGDVPMPDLVCMTYEAAKFMLSAYELTQAAANTDGSVDNFSQAYVYKQEPAYEEGKLIPSGTGFILYLTQDAPTGCP